MSLRTLIAGMTIVVAALALAPATAASAAFPGANGDIAFGRSSQGQVDIWVVFAGVTGTARLTNTPNRDESMPDWNASGTRLAYARCAGSKLGNCDIFTMDADGSDVPPLTATPDVQETWPAWSPDGTQIAPTPRTPRTASRTSGSWTTTGRTRRASPRRRVSTPSPSGRPTGRRSRSRATEPRWTTSG